MTREDELFGRLRGGDEAALEELIRSHYPGILRYCLGHTPDRQTAEDAALGFGFGLAAALWIFRTELGELCAELGTAPAAAVCAALLAALALECRQLLRQLPARDMQQALSY